MFGLRTGNFIGGFVRRDAAAQRAIVVPRVAREIIDACTHRADRCWKLELASVDGEYPSGQMGRPLIKVANRLAAETLRTMTYP